MARLEHIHSKGFIHRDIKPDNFLIGLGKKASMIYLVDFGLAKLFRNPMTGQHIPFRRGKPLIGTARYASISTHAGIEQSRRDDLESVMYTLIYFMRGKLPWQGLKETSKEGKYKQIMELKRNTPIETLCEGVPSNSLHHKNRGVWYIIEVYKKHEI